MSDHFHNEPLWVLARKGDSQAFKQVFSPLKSYATSLSRRFFAPGFDPEDLYQEALAGFASALFSFESGGPLSFEEFAKLSMRNNVVATVRHATRLKRSGWISAEIEIAQSASQEDYRPDLLVELRVECVEVLRSLRATLSELEWMVLTETLVGASIDEVAERHGLDQRAAENALSRARAKARRLRDAA